MVDEFAVYKIGNYQFFFKFLCAAACLCNNNDRNRIIYVFCLIFFSTFFAPIELYVCTFLLIFFICTNFCLFIFKLAFYSFFSLTLSCCCNVHFSVLTKILKIKFFFTFILITNDRHVLS